MQRQPSKQPEPQDGTSAPTVNVFNCSNASYELMRRVMVKYGWEATRSERCDLYWSDQKWARALYRQSPPPTHVSRINQLPLMGTLCTKDVNTHALDMFRALAPEDYDFYPKTWDLPLSKAEFKRDFETGRTYILKPSAGRQGMGIVLTQDYRQVEEEMRRAGAGCKWVAQEYLDDPLLLDGFKFDMRVYVLVESLNPLKIHVFRDGLARLCTQKYVPPTKQNLQQAFMHLTNYAVNKNSKGYKAPEEGDEDDDGDAGGGAGEDDADMPLEMTNIGALVDGADDQTTAEEMALRIKSSKRTIATAITQLIAAGVKLEEDQFWKDIENVVCKTVLAMWAQSWSAYLQTFYPDFDTPGDAAAGAAATAAAGGGGSRPVSPRFPNRCFHVLGFDIMMDSKLKPWLLEINAAPSFATDSPLDMRIKQSIMERCLQVVGMIGPRELRIHQQRFPGSRTDNVSGAAAAAAAAAPAPLPPTTTTATATTTAAQTADPPNAPRGKSPHRGRSPRRTGLAAIATSKLADAARQAGEVAGHKSPRSASSKRATTPGRKASKKKKSRETTPRSGGSDQADDSDYVSVASGDTNVSSSAVSAAAAAARRSAGGLSEFARSIAASSATGLGAAPAAPRKRAKSARRPKRGRSPGATATEKPQPQSQQPAAPQPAPSSSVTHSRTQSSLGPAARSMLAQQSALGGGGGGGGGTLTRPPPGALSRRMLAADVVFGPYDEAKRQVEAAASGGTPPLLTELQLEQIEWSEEVNFQELDYTSLRPAYLFSHLYIFSNPILLEVYRLASTRRLDVGVTPAKFTRLLNLAGLLSSKSCTRVDVHLMYLKVMKEGATGTGSAGSMLFAQFCEALVLVSRRRYADLAPLKAFGRLVDSITASRAEWLTQL